MKLRNQDSPCFERYSSFHGAAAAERAHEDSLRALSPPLDRHRCRWDLARIFPALATFVS